MRTEHAELLPRLQLADAPTDIVALPDVTAGQAVSADIGLQRFPAAAPVAAPPVPVTDTLAPEELMVDGLPVIITPYS